MKYDKQYFKEVYENAIKDNKEIIDEKVTKALSEFEGKIKENVVKRAVVYVESKYEDIIIKTIENEYDLFCGRYGEITSEFIPYQPGKTALYIEVE